MPKIIEPIRSTYFFSISVPYYCYRGTKKIEKMSLANSIPTKNAKIINKIFLNLIQLDLFILFSSIFIDKIFLSYNDYFVYCPYNSIRNMDGVPKVEIDVDNKNVLNK